MDVGEKSPSNPAAIFHRKGGEIVGPQGWGPKPRRSGVRRVGVSSGGFEGWEAQNFALFFFPSPVGNFTLSSLSGGLFVEFWWCFEAPGRSNVHVWSSLVVV